MILKPLYQPKPKRLPWRKSVTLCIAAVCQDENQKPAIVLCADHKIGNFAAQAEIGFKFSWACTNWPALVAGDLSRTEELVATFLDTLDSSTFTRVNVFDQMKSAGHIFREKLVDELVRKKLSVSYDYLRQNRAKFPSSTVYQAFTEISQIDSEAELITVGFIDEKPYIFVINRDCTVSHRQHFAAIGTGAYIAEPALFQRKQKDKNSIVDTVYKVFEAKKLGEIADSVGEKTSLLVVSPPPKKDGYILSKYLSIEGKEQMMGAYQRFGLKPIDVDGITKEKLFTPLPDKNKEVETEQDE